MSPTQPTAEELFEPLAVELLGEPRISKAKMFGGVALKTDNKVFACLFKGKLVVKLSKDRCEELIRSGTAEPFDPGMGRVMREWVAIDPRAEPEWRDLTQEARGFVRELNSYL